MSQRYLNNTFYSLIFFVIQLLVALWTSPVIINSVGKQNYGVIVVVNTMSLFGWLSLMDIGLQGALTKHFADAFRSGDSGRERAKQLFHSALSIYLLCGAVACFVVMALSGFPGFFTVDPMQYSLLSRAFTVIAAFNLLLFPLLSVIAVAEGLQEYRLIKVIGIYALLGWALAVYLLARTGAGVLYFLIADYMKTALQFLLILAVVRVKLPWFGIALKWPRLSELKSIANLSIDLFISRITGIVFNQTDVLIITLLLGQTAIVSDYYSANAMFVTIIGITAVFNSVVVSETAWLSQSDSLDRIKELAVTGTRVTSAYVLPVSVAVFVWAPDILRVWLGSEFEKNGQLLRIFMIALVPITASGVTSTLLIGIDRLRGVLWVPILSVLINLVISLAGVKPFGIIALAIGTTLAYLVGSLLYNRYCLSLLDSPSIWFYRVTMAKPLAISCVVGALGYWMRSAFPIDRLWQMVAVIVLFVSVNYCLIMLFSTRTVRRELITVIGLGRFGLEESSL